MEKLTVSNTPELLEFSALSGEEVTIHLVDNKQTAIVQHHVNVVMDCTSLIESGGKLLGPVEWTRLSYFEGDDGLLAPQGSEITIYQNLKERLRAEGELNRYLNITTTNIIRGAEREDNGLYTCTICTETGCRSSSVMLFLIGSVPRLDSASDNGELLKTQLLRRHLLQFEYDIVCYTATEEISSLSFADKRYSVGADFCVERGSVEMIELSCDVLGEDLADHISIAFPTPSRKWFKDDVLLYSVDKIGQSVYRGTNPDFYNGPNGILRYGVVEPSPLYMSKQGQVVLGFEASDLVYPDFAPAGTTNETIVDDVFNALIGKWRCEVENTLGIQTAETVITEC